MTSPALSAGLFLSINVYLLLLYYSFCRTTGLLMRHAPTITSGRHFSLRKYVVLRRRSRAGRVLPLLIYADSVFRTFAVVSASFNPVLSSVTTRLDWFASSSELMKLLLGNGSSDPGRSRYLNQPKVRSTCRFGYTAHPVGVLPSVGTELNNTAFWRTVVMYRRLHVSSCSLVYSRQKHAGR